MLIGVLLGTAGSATDCVAGDGPLGTPEIDPGYTGEIGKIEPGDVVALGKFVKGATDSPEGMIDATIGVMTLAWPPAGIALGVGKTLFGMLGAFDKPDATALAIEAINERLRDLDSRVGRIESALAELESTVFKNDNYNKLQRLKDRHRQLAAEIAELRGMGTSVLAFSRPLTDQERERIGRLIDRVLNLADTFLRTGPFSDPELWNWSDFNLKRKVYLRPDFRPLPTLEYYLLTLGVAMTAINRYVGDEPATLKLRYGPRLERHADMLANTLDPEISARITCQIQASDRYPNAQSMCTGNWVCQDTLSYRVARDSNIDRYQPDRNALCNLSSLAGDEPSLAGNMRDQYGRPAMRAVAERLRRAATTGEFRLTPYVPTRRQPFYVVRVNGELQYYEHVVLEEQPLKRPIVSDRVSIERQSTMPPVQDDTPADRMFDDQLNSPRRLGPPVAELTARPVISGSDVTMFPPSRMLDGGRHGPPKPGTHNLEGPHVLGGGWDRFTELLSIGPSAFLAIAQNGTLQWYSNVGSVGAGPQLTGPVNINAGWNRFARVTAGGDSRLYGIDPDGSLVWYHYQRAYDPGAAIEPPWRGPIVVGSGWAQFQHVFATGGGLLFAVTPDGRLLSYRHDGFANGSDTWREPKQVDTGWSGFKHIFSPGEGHIYAIKPGGELLYYQFTRYTDDTIDWYGPVQISSGFGDVTRAFSPKTDVLSAGIPR
ncbi:hypothetical protein JKG68_31120 [Microvirga aerilata]|uniref:Tachylectin 2 domain-containing protein n=1 Tax=Microvirga aerilata TaxID=670292 RepID=A0A936ZJG4_9HYPH|nr:tachylectin-related carbohydrate-binding protein [Microvirga aerilata]MBL0408327.1 hypothetical protein [Microvirga aerilata]